MPHITLTTYEKIDLQVVKDRINQLCGNAYPFEILFSSYGYFPSEEGVLFLNPITNIALLNVQQKVFELFEGVPDDNSPETWVPHSTLATDISLESIGKALDIAKEVIVMKMGAPFCVEAESIVIVEFTTDPPTVLSTAEFRFKEKKPL